MRAMASHDGFLTKCGQNHDALLTAVVVDITAVLEADHLHFSNQERQWRLVTPPGVSCQPVLA
jgi:hypothetical protein